MKERLKRTMKMNTDARLLIKVPLRVMAISAGYAAALALFERKFRLKPDHEWLEVAIGVGLTIVPVAFEAHSIEQEQKHGSAEPISWKTYEGAVWRSFMASGAPIIFWQIGEAIIRKWELMGYLTKDGNGRSDADANTAAQVANGSGEPAEGGTQGGNGGYSIFAGGPEES
jgi:hypothetical protein